MLSPDRFSNLRICLTVQILDLPRQYLNHYPPDLYFLISAVPWLSPLICWLPRLCYALWQGLSSPASPRLPVRQLFSAVARPSWVLSGFFLALPWLLYLSTLTGQDQLPASSGIPGGQPESAPWPDGIAVVTGLSQGLSSACSEEEWSPKIPLVRLLPMVSAVNSWLRLHGSYSLNLSVILVASVQNPCHGC